MREYRESYSRNGQCRSHRRRVVGFDGKSQGDVGTDFTLPALTSVKIGGTQITAGITVKVVYTDITGAEQEAAGTFKPLLKRDFSLKYYYGSVFLAQLDVAVSGGTTGNLVGKNGMEIGSEVARYTGQQVYGEKVSASLPAEI